MKRILISVALFLLLPAAALAQQPLAGSSLRLSSQPSLPNNLNGNSGVYNLNGRYTWHTGGTDQTILSCATCSTNVLPYFDTLSGVTALPSNWFYNSGSKQFCSEGASNTMCIRLDESGGVADIGYHIGIGDGNFIQSDTVGTKIFHNGANFAQTVGSGAAEEWQVKGKIESTTGGYVFPDATVQTTAATGGSVPDILYSPVSIALAAVSNNTIATVNTTAQNFTTAQKFSMIAFGKTCIAGHGYWAGGAVTLRIKLCNAGVALASKDIAVAGAGAFTATFASGVAMTPGKSYFISVWDTTGAAGHYTSYGVANALFLSGNNAIYAGPSIIWAGFAWYDSGGGDGVPDTVTGNTEVYPIEPVFQ